MRSIMKPESPSYVEMSYIMIEGGVEQSQSGL